MRAWLVFNPCAGAAERLEPLLPRLTEEHDCQIQPTSRERGAAAIARQAVDEGVDRIIVAGGDGTIAQVVAGVAPDFAAVELGVLPLGTGNDLARSLGILPRQLRQACRDAVGPDVEAIDLIQVVEANGDKKSYCVNVANGGFGGRVAVDVEAEDKRRWGPAAYWMTSVTRILDLQQYQVQLTLDDQQRQVPAFGVAVANGRFVGGGFPIAPSALLNDGLLDVTTIPVLPKLQLMAAGLNFAMGWEEREERLRTARVGRLRLKAEPTMPFSIDGELVREMDVLFEVLPRALRVAVGAKPPGLIDAPSPLD